VDHGFEFSDAARKLVDGLAFGIRQFAVFERIELNVAFADHSAGHSDDGRVRGYRTNDHGTCSNLYVIADVNVAEDLRAGSDHRAIAYGRVTLAAVFSGTAESHALVQQNIVADFRGFSDYYAHSMIDKAAAADGGAGVNFDAGHGARELGDHAGEREPSGFVNAVRDSVQDNGVEAGVAEENFQHAARRRVAAENGVDLFTDSREQNGAPPDMMPLSREKLRRIMLMKCGLL
jgi:hypothetical protein